MGEARRHFDVGKDWVCSVHAYRWTWVSVVCVFAWSHTMGEGTHRDGARRSTLVWTWHVMLGYAGRCSGHVTSMDTSVNVGCMCMFVPNGWCGCWTWHLGLQQVHAMRLRGGSHHSYLDVANAVGWANDGDIWCVGTHTNGCTCGAQLAKRVQYLCIHACGCSCHSRSDVAACGTGHMCATTCSCWALRPVHPLSSARPPEHGSTWVHTCLPCLRAWAFLTVGGCVHTLAHWSHLQVGHGHRWLLSQRLHQHGCGCMYRDVPGSLCIYWLSEWVRTGVHCMCISGLVLVAQVAYTWGVSVRLGLHLCVLMWLHTEGVGPCELHRPAVRPRVLQCAWGRHTHEIAVHAHV